MTLDDELVEAVDKMVKKQTKGYLKHPINNNEFSVWENEQDWGDK